MSVRARVRVCVCRGEKLSFCSVIITRTWAEGQACAKTSSSPGSRYPRMPCSTNYYLHHTWGEGVELRVGRGGIEGYYDILSHPSSGPVVRITRRKD